MGLGYPGEESYKYWAYDDHISFCEKASPLKVTPLNECDFSGNKINTLAGKTDYATLLTALTTGQKVSFYCDVTGYAVNIHIAT